MATRPVLDRVLLACRGRLQNAALVLHGWTSAHRSCVVTRTLSQSLILGLRLEHFVI